jgi:hypothetical protein
MVTLHFGTGAVSIERLLGVRCLGTALAKAPTSRRTPRRRSIETAPVSFIPMMLTINASTKYFKKGLENAYSK